MCLITCFCVSSTECVIKKFILTSAEFRSILIPLSHSLYSHFSSTSFCKRAGSMLMGTLQQTLCLLELIVPVPFTVPLPVTQLQKKALLCDSLNKACCCYSWVKSWHLLMLKRCRRKLMSINQASWRVSGELALKKWICIFSFSFYSWTNLTWSGWETSGT